MNYLNRNKPKESEFINKKPIMNIQSPFQIKTTKTKEIEDKLKTFVIKEKNEIKEKEDEEFLNYEIQFDLNQINKYEMEFEEHLEHLENLLFLEVTVDTTYDDETEIWEGEDFTTQNLNEIKSFDTIDLIL